MWMNNLEHEKLKTAVILARMYGVKETLEPLPCISNEKMIDLITKWTEEYFDTAEEDIEQFFEGKFQDNTSMKKDNR